MKVYTKKGDFGLTLTANHEAVKKSDCLIEVNGVLDALQSAIDRVIYGLDVLPDMEYKYDFCVGLQERLRFLGGEISGATVKYPITEDDVRALEIQMDGMNIDVNEFVRFSNPISMDVDEARVRTRALERVMTTYLENHEISNEAYKFINRMSDFFFVLAVSINEKYEE
jgi:cob(I)alamin adenosyltransferase